MATDTEKFRTFIGIRPNEAALKFIKSFKRQYGKAAWAKHIRWTAEPNIHITMRFLGDLVQQQITQIQTGLDLLLQDQTSFEVTINSPRPFPTAKKARMLAALVHKNEELQRLAEAIEALVVDAGVAPEQRAFRGHLTVGRFRRPVKGLDELLQQTATLRMPVDHIILFKSELKPTGAEYTEIANFRFQPLRNN